MYIKVTFLSKLISTLLACVFYSNMYFLKMGRQITPCSGSPGNERAGDNQNHLNDLNDELALLIGIERLDQLFYLYYIGIIHSPIVIKNKNKNEFVLKHII